MAIALVCDKCRRIVDKDDFFKGNFRNGLQAAKSGFQTIKVELCRKCFEDLLSSTKQDGDEED